MLGSLLCVIYFFHMPLFVFVSGLFSKNVTKRRNRAFDDLIVPLIAAQLVWLVVRVFTYGPSWALEHLFTPQFQLWYLMALYIWRMILPDLIRVRCVLTAAAVLFFLVHVVNGIDDVLALRKTMAFLFFFLLGYKADLARVVRLVERVPFVLAVIIFVASFAGLFCFFAGGYVSYEAVFNLLRHGSNIGEKAGYVFGFVAYSVAFVGAVVLSVCFLRLAVAFKSWRPIIDVGSDTMPLFILHGWAVYGICALLGIAPELCEWLMLLLLVLLTVGVTYLLSVKSCRDAYSRIMAIVSGVVTRSLNSLA